MKRTTEFAIILFFALLLGACSTLQSGKQVKEPAPPDYQKAYNDYVQLGAQYMRLGRYDLAEPKLKRAIEIDSRPPQAWNMLAVLYEQTRNISAGNQIYRKVIHSHPDYELGFMNYATFLCKFKREDERKALYAQMRNKGGDFSTLSYIAAGDCARARNNPSDARVQYLKALEQDAYAAGALLPLADIAVNRKNYREAIRYLTVIHTYVGYSAESVRLAILAARGNGDAMLEKEMTRIMRGNYAATPQANSLGL